MKNLKEYLLESISVEKVDGRTIVTLVRRENLDLVNLSEEDFIKYIKEDFQTALEEYRKVVEPYNEESKKTYMDRMLADAVKFAETKWKTNKKREEYIEKVKATTTQNIEKGYYLGRKKVDGIFFDLKPDASMGIRSECVINKESSDRDLKIAFEEMQKSKFFKKGTGWAFKYWASSKDDLSYSLRPYIDILLDESTRAEQKRDERNLSAAVDDFYSNTTYWGD